MRHDRYYEMGCLIALNMLHGGPPPSFFSKPLYFSLFHYPKDFSFSHSDINEPWLIAKMKKVQSSLLFHLASSSGFGPVIAMALFVCLCVCMFVHLQCVGSPAGGTKHTISSASTVVQGAISNCFSCIVVCCCRVLG